MPKLTAAQKASVLAQRAARDPLFHFRPSPTQQKFLDSDAYYRMVTGGTRSGKTTASIYDLSLVVRGKHPTKPWQGPVNAIVFCVSRQNASMVVQEKLLRHSQLPGKIGEYPMIPPWEIESTGLVKVAGIKVSQCVSLKNGSTIHFSWSDVDDTWKRIQGAKIQYVYIDENAGNKELLKQCRARVLDSQHPGTWHGCITWGGHGTEINEAFEDFRRRCLDAEDKDHQLFQILPGETGAVTSDALERFKKTLSEDEQKVYITAEETSSNTVLIYGKQFDDDRHILDTDYEPGPDDNIWVGLDPGGAGKASHPTGIGFFVIKPNAPLHGEMTQVIVADYIETKRLTIDQNLAIIRGWLKGRTLEGFVVDPAVTKSDPYGKSLETTIHEVVREMGIESYRGILHGNNRHWDGIVNVQRYLCPVMEHAEHPPMLVFNPRCKLAIQEIKAYRGKLETRFTGEGGVVKKFDEFPDVARYVLSKTPYYCKRRPNRMADELPAQALATLTPDQHEHEARLRASATRLRQILPGRTPGIGTGTLLWG